ncbi:hypothetical protein NDU88_005080 [Pleurodeles waltl]|uniref:Uncharacterized protein n=1 Tax=Pleurodeles waltl TaxID=8319 RepID=A0AAV7RLA8_PLEWA|nr:hypothetical protein NDU88_005080 [Pleurodeles waltl]
MPRPLRPRRPKPGAPGDQAPMPLVPISPGVPLHGAAPAPVGLCSPSRLNGLFSFCRMVTEIAESLKLLHKPRADAAGTILLAGYSALPSSHPSCVSAALGDAPGEGWSPRVLCQQLEKEQRVRS